MNLPARFSKACCLPSVLFARIVLASPPLVQVSSAIWADQTPPPIPATRLLAILSTGPPIRLTSPGSQSEQPTLLSLLRPETPDGPSSAPNFFSSPSLDGDIPLEQQSNPKRTEERQWADSTIPPSHSPTWAHDLIPNPTAFQDVSLGSQFIGRKTQDGPSKALKTQQVDSSPWEPVLIPNAAFFEDVSLASGLSRKKSNDGPPNDFAIPEPNLPSWGPVSISNAASFDDASIVPQSIERKRRESHSNLLTSNPNPSSPTPPSPLDPPTPKTSSHAPDEIDLDYAGSLPLEKKRRLDRSKGDTSNSSPSSSTPLSLTDAPGSTGSASTRHENIHGHPQTVLPISNNQVKQSHGMMPSRGRGHRLESDQLPIKPDPSNQPLDNNIIQMISSILKEEAPKSLYLDLIQSTPRFLAVSGHIAVSLLVKYHEMFSAMARCQRIMGVAYNVLVPRTSQESLTMLPRSRKQLGYVVRILRRSDGQLQTATQLIVLHRHLIRWVYKIHGRKLKELKIPTYVHYSQSEEMLNWIHEQVFTSLDGTPLMGIKDTPLPLWGVEDKLGPAKLILLNYLRQDEIDDELAFSTAWKLTHEFEDHHPHIYSAPINSLEDSRSTHISPDFEQRMSILLQLATKMKLKFDFLFVTSRQHEGDDKLMKSSLSTLKIADVKLGSMSGHRLSPHPNLPISMYYVRGEPGYGLTRVERYEGKPLILIKVAVLFKRLLRAANLLNVEILKQFRFKESEINTRRQKLLDWLHEITLEPQNGVPVIGRVTLKHEDLAPWDDESFGQADVFTPIQRSLIEYFSKKPNTKDLQDHTAFILTSWYQDQFPDQFKSLIKIFKNKFSPASGSGTLVVD
ncbi:hypothetical protein Pst134EA_021183 [Puccinia striiformis f. sp. tritici]|uniref:hypothetical protein n=1 Tax=Puccinia striiformis f. sp. tritici TaxID=168172 RepID=UPI002008222B|nr:hypothetical protein Pst134EA_021183 [Puccinia striiformis f. sp. tritici]KAH9457301.1 hypothetical protein Pst134EA_021183 [Puccinia striiformis f. sp. tritici]